MIYAGRHNVLCEQAGPLIKVKIPKDNDGKQKSFGFAVFKHEESAPYGMNLLNGTSLFGRTLKVQFRAGNCIDCIAKLTLKLVEIHQAKCALTRSYP